MSYNILSIRNMLFTLFMFLWNIFISFLFWNKLGTLSGSSKFGKGCGKKDKRSRNSGSAGRRLTKEGMLLAALSQLTTTTTKCCFDKSTSIQIKPTGQLNDIHVKSTKQHLMLVVSQRHHKM